MNQEKQSQKVGISLKFSNDRKKNSAPGESTQTEVCSTAGYDTQVDHSTEKAKYEHKRPINYIPASYHVLLFAHHVYLSYLKQELFKIRLCY